MLHLDVCKWCSSNIEQSCLHAIIRSCICQNHVTIALHNRMWNELHGGSWINNWNFFDRVGTWALKFLEDHKSEKMTCLFIRMVHQLVILESICSAQNQWSKILFHENYVSTWKTFELEFNANSMKNVVNTWTWSDSEDDMNKCISESKKYFSRPWKWQDEWVDGGIRA